MKSTWPLIALGLLIGGSALAAELMGQDLVQDSGSHVSAAVSSDPQVRWQQYLAANGWDEGPNGDPSGYFFIASGTARVGGAFETGWVEARNAAYKKAVLLAKSAMAEWVRGTIDSQRSIDFLAQGRVAAPEVTDAVEADKQLSLIEKSTRIVNAELDEIMRRYDPDWDGTGLSDAEKRRRVVAHREVLRDSLKQRARMMVRGASPIFNAEGPNDLNQYTVTVGIVWSPKLLAVAESFHNPHAKQAPGKPDDSIRDRIETMLKTDPHSLAAFQGLRVWRDRAGNPVLVSVHAADRFGSEAIIRRRNALNAKAQIATFIAEDIAARDNTNGHNTLDIYAGGSTSDYDETRFETKITAVARRIPISGATHVLTWKGTHPVAKVPMCVSFYAWSLASANLARRFESMSDTFAVGAARPASAGELPSAGLTGPSASRANF